MTSFSCTKILPEDSHRSYKISLIKPKCKSLYYAWAIDLLARPALGIVGPRLPSPYAQRVVCELLEQAKQFPLATISGLASGVDQLAHEISLQQNIPTIAVLGGGIAHYQKGKDRALLERIVNVGGLVLSEYEPDQKPAPYTFPQRNRIIAWLADLLFLPEAGKESGSLITVDEMNALHKPVYGAPGSIFSPQSAGLHEYIAKGNIHLARDLPRMLAKYFAQQQENTRKNNLKNNTTEKNNIEYTNLKNNNTECFFSSSSFSPDMLRIYESLLDQGECSIEQLIVKTSLPYASVISTLTLLELANATNQIRPGIFAPRR